MISDVEISRMNWLQFIFWYTGLRTLWRNRPVLVSRAALMYVVEQNERSENYQRLMWKARTEKLDAACKIMRIAESDNCPLEIRDRLDTVVIELGMVVDRDFVQATEVR
jgi:hypothetical protein